MRLSRIAEQTSTPPILMVAARINEKIARGEQFFNFTVGDFDPCIYPIPGELTEAVIGQYRDHQTNYPGAPGLEPLRQGVSRLIEHAASVNYDADEIQISSGSRPLIYAMYRSVVDPGDKVVYPVPSWMNDAYCHLCGAVGVPVDTSASNNFMPTAEALEPHLGDAAMLALCSPQNPTGTVFKRDQLKDICDLVVAENKRRPAGSKPLYVMFDQVYWLLTFDGIEYPHPVNLCPDIRDFVLFADGLSKSFAGTGVRVGWASGPRHLIKSVSDIIAYVGAWAPKPEQRAVAQYLDDLNQVDAFLNGFRHRLSQRLTTIHEGFEAMKTRGLDVEAISPMAGIYLTVRIPLLGKRTSKGQVLNSSNDALDYLLDEARVGVIPFSFFGASDQSEWYRISVGTCDESVIPEFLNNLETSLDRLDGRLE
ncbi:MAG: aminotransferase [marine bacterium B5-7]|nr:MAG: aminotransferase [marine bacterium B5-7]